MCQGEPDTTLQGWQDLKTAIASYRIGPEEETHGYGLVAAFPACIWTSPLNGPDYWKCEYVVTLWCPCPVLCSSDGSGNIPGALQPLMPSAVGPGQTHVKPTNLWSQSILRGKNFLLRLSFRLT